MRFSHLNFRLKRLFGCRKFKRVFETNNKKNTQNTDYQIIDTKLIRFNLKSKSPKTQAEGKMGS
jgi:hypothetical protein